MQLSIILLVTLAVFSFAKESEYFYDILSKEEIESSFAADGWIVRDYLTTDSGSRGFYAESVNETSLVGAPKKSYYVEGSSFEMGWLHGGLTAKNGDAQKMCTTYLHHIILNLLNEQWDEEMAAKCEAWDPYFASSSSKDNVHATKESDISCEAYEALLTFLEDWLIAGSFASFSHERKKIPDTLIAEMEGFVSGAQDKDPDAGCTFEKMIYLNYGIDFLMGNLYTGHLPRVVSEQAAISGKVTESIVKELASMDASKVFSIPYMCDSFGVSSAATASGDGVFMARDFQLTTGLVYQDTAADVIYVPKIRKAVSKDENTIAPRIPHLSSGAPGFVGRVTGVNALGVTMGVDLLRAAPCDPYAPGLNSIQLIRHVMDNAASTDEAVEIVASASRGTTWLYPICDASGKCVTIEAGKSIPKGEPFNPLQYVNSSDIKAALPSEEFYRRHSSDDIFDRGIYIRPMDWKFKDEYLDYNKGLYETAGVEYSDSDEVWGVNGFVFSGFEEENEVTNSKLHNNFFPPQRESLVDVTIISNNAIVPEMRTSMMSYGGNFWQITAHAAQWRYDSLNSLISNQYGTIDVDSCIDIISFLSPERSPGYWTNTINENDPMSAIVEGTINVVDVLKRRIHSKTGYWSDGWTHLTLSKFYKEYSKN